MYKPTHGHPHVNKLLFEVNQQICSQINFITILEIVTMIGYEISCGYIPFYFRWTQVE